MFVFDLSSRASCIHRIGRCASSSVSHCEVGTTLPSQTLEKGYPLDNLIEAVNIVGSLFYSSILGIFVVAFFLKRAGGNAVFAAALTAEALVLTLYATTDIGFLWFHAIGCIVVYVLAAIFSSFPAARQSTTRSVG